jgi:diguanylate cyclase (GGDEF)-like protein
VAPHDSDKTRVTRISGEAKPRAEGPGEACVIVIYGPELGKRMQLGTAPFSIGRSTKNDLSIDQESISRHHAKITFEEGSFRIEDLGSTNGTFVNEERVQTRALGDGDQVQIGRSILKFMTGENVEVHYHEEIYRLMTVDALTQIFNRRYFNEALEREFNRARRYQRDLSLILFDIDHFKKVNDTYGHLAGDNLLRAMVLAMKPKLRREDVFARTGGEEFGVLLPEINLEGARFIAEKLRKIAEATEVRFEAHLLKATVSLGISQLIANMVGEQLYKSADEALYQAKNTGRNRVCG